MTNTPEAPTVDARLTEGAALLESAINEIKNQRLVDTDKMVDLLLDVRLILLKVEA